MRAEFSPGCLLLVTRVFGRMALNFVGFAFNRSLLYDLGTFSVSLGFDISRMMAGDGK